MLEVIGAGAATESATQWYERWINSPEARRLREEITTLHEKGRVFVPAAVNRITKYSTPWGRQLHALLERDLRTYWRDPSYLLTKLVLNVALGLIIGFSFFNAPNTVQGLQNQM